MIEDLGTNPSSSCPWAYDDHRDPIAQTERRLAKAIGRGTGIRLLVLCHIIHFRIDARRHLSRMLAVGIWHHKRRHMIEVAVILVIGEDKNGLLPYFGV